MTLPLILSAAYAELALKREKEEEREVIPTFHFSMFACVPDVVFELTYALSVLSVLIFCMTVCSLYQVFKKLPWEYFIHGLKH